MHGVRQPVPGVFTWARFSEEKQLDFNGYYLPLHHGPVLIDPPILPEEDAAEIESMGRPVKIILTNKDHRRGAPEARRRFRCPIALHSADVALIECEIDETFEDGDRLANGALTVVHVPEGKSPGECALWWAERRILFLGDALIGKPPGALSLLPPEKFADAARAKKALEHLRRLNAQTVFVGDGISILRDAQAALEAFLDG